MKNILCLGAGLVARPYIQYLCKHGLHVTVASRTKEKAERLIQGCDNAAAVEFNIAKDDKLLEKLVSEANLVCSLLPYTFHVKAARVAIQHKKHFCTTSYISEEMRSLDNEATKAGILILNECGVDPGIDHMSAMKIIDAIHNEKGKVVSFTSFTGGLPAPEANNNPFGYKLSWSPRGVLLAGRNEAQFLRNGEIITIPGHDLFDNCEIMEVPGMGQFEGYPNRDSLSYIDTYNIPETKTMIRGTLRNIGWCRTLKKIADLGLLDITERTLENFSYSQMLKNLVLSDEENIRLAVASRLSLEPSDSVLNRFDWLGLFSDESIPTGVSTYLDALCHLFEQKLQYESSERDMIIMHHDFIAEFPDRLERITSTMINYGIPNGDSSMSRTVALPVAIASRLILEGKIDLSGVHRPIMAAVYNPILEELETLDIKLEENTTLL